MTEDPYVYPGTNVLRNSFGIDDAEILAQTEADIVGLALAVLEEDPVPGDYDLAHWQAFHRRIFGALYPWAGELRTVQLQKPNALYALREHIVRYAQGIFENLAGEDRLKHLSRPVFVERLTFYHAEMYAVHPFREGNTRSLRAFLGQLAREAGHRVAWKDLDHPQSVAANTYSLNGQNGQLHALLERIVDSSQG